MDFQRLDRCVDNLEGLMRDTEIGKLSTHKNQKTYIDSFTYIKFALAEIARMKELADSVGDKIKDMENDSIELGKILDDEPKGANLTL